MINGSRSFAMSIFAPLFSAFVVISVCAALYLRETGEMKKSLLDREAIRMNVFDRLMQRDLQSVISDLEVLADGEGLRAYLLSGHKEDFDRAIHRAVFFSNQEPDYDQIRYLDEKGQEIIRVNQGGEVVPPVELENKANRPYFQKASHLSLGQVYISTIDLNVENGRIEQPYKPTICFATPVFDQAGQRRGTYVINYRAANIVKRLQEFIPLYKNRLRVINPQGYWIHAANPDQELGFMFPDKQGITLALTDSDLWKQVSANSKGQVPYKGGYFSWEKLVPREAAKRPSVTIVADDDFIVMGSEITSEEWDAVFVNLRQSFIAVSILLIILIWVIWWFFRLRLRAQQNLDRVFTLSRDLLCIAGFDGYFQRVNPAWESTLGYTAEELTSRPYLDFIHPEDRKKTEAVASQQESGYEVLSFENRYRCKDGSYRWLSWSARPLVEEKLIFASARDLTERKATEEKVLVLNEELKQRASQLESANKELESFSYSVSHDLRAPLRHIHGFVEILQKAPGIAGDDKNLRYMTIIATAARDMGRLIDDLLDFSRTGRAEMHPVPVDMHQMVDKVIKELEPEWKGRKVEWKIGTLPKVACDQNLLRLVWMNLLTNALKYSRPREETKIEIGQKTGDGSGARPGEVVLYVRDNGVGFDMQYVAKLFGVFQRLHKAEDFEGTGIGLANVQRIIARHGGRVWADAQVDGGATFYFSLPSSNRNT